MSIRPLSIWLGYDPREFNAYAVAKHSIRTFDRHIPICPVILSRLKDAGLYTRPTQMRLGRLWDEISEHEMSTEFAISRFLVPELTRRTFRKPYGWALFMDCDVMVRRNFAGLRTLLDDSKAVMCVKHEHEPTTAFKMDDQIQSAYQRKNWSSVIAFNVDHPANAALTVDMVNTLPGRDLHRLCWLDDKHIGALPPEWNYLVGHTQLPEFTWPAVVHFTDGIPTFAGYRECEYADEWFQTLERCA